MRGRAPEVVCRVHNKRKAALLKKRTVIPESELCCGKRLKTVFQKLFCAIVSTESLNTIKICLISV